MASDGLYMTFKLYSPFSLRVIDVLFSDIDFKATAFFLMVTLQTYFLFPTFAKTVAVPALMPFTTPYSKP